MDDYGGFGRAVGEMDVHRAGIASARDGLAVYVEGGEREELEVRLADYDEVISHGFNRQQQIRLSRHQSVNAWREWE